MEREADQKEQIDPMAESEFAEMDAGNTLPDGAALFMVATPIGNLADITLRALSILKQSDIVLSEDTRKTGILLHHYGIEARKKSYRVHHLEGDTDHAIALLKEGKKLSFCTDAGTPGISDPGSHLVRAVREKLPHVPVIPIPGPSAMGALLSVCGWQVNPSLFLGFLSPKSGKRKKILREYEKFSGVIVLYESVYRFKRLLTEIHGIFPEREVLVGREITKKFEQILLIPGKLDENEYQRLIDGIPEKGEFSIMIGPIKSES